MKIASTLAFMLSLMTYSAFAQEQFNIMDLCQGKAPEGLVVLDNGFCDAFLAREEDMHLKEAAMALQTGVKPVIKEDGCLLFETKDRWKLRFYASHSYTTYFNSDIEFQSTRYNMEIQNYEWAERSSREFFEPKTWQEEGHNPFQIFDEPTNTFVISIEKDGNEFFLSAFHPKFLQAPDQIKYMKGTIDGVSVDGVGYINKPFDGYDQDPGESELVNNSNTYRQMIFELGYGRRINIVKGKFGSLTYVPSVALGVMLGNNVSIMVEKGEWWEFEEHFEPYGIQGWGGSITNRLEFNTPKERFGVFYENKLGYYFQNHGFLDGTQKYQLGFMGNSVGFKFMIYNPNNHKKK